MKGNIYYLFHRTICATHRQNTVKHTCSAAFGAVVAYISFYQPNRLMKKKPAPHEQNIDKDLLLEVSDLQNRTYFIRMLHIKNLRVRDKYVTVAPDNHDLPAPVVVRSALTLLLQKLPLHYFIQVNRHEAVNKLYIRDIDGRDVELHDGSHLYFSARYYTEYKRCA